VTPQVSRLAAQLLPAQRLPEGWASTGFDKMADDGSNDAQHGRRAFLDLAITGTAGAVGVAALYPAVRFVEPVSEGAATSKAVGKVNDFEPGSAKSLLLGDIPVLIVRLKDNSFKAYVATCPHLGCVVHYEADDDAILCACHRGRFAVEGHNVSGPPVRPLDALRVDTTSDGTVIVSKVS